MATFFMFGIYSVEGMEDISSERTADARKLIEGLGGSVRSMYALMGEHDLVMIVDFPAIQQAMKASIGLTKLTGITFTTAPAVEVTEFDQLATGT